MIAAFPELLPVVEGRIPFVVNCYPAAFGASEDAIFVDTYLRPETFSRALLLARERQWLPIIPVQPLPALHFVLRHVEQGLTMPPAAVLFLGGYAVPSSLEASLLRLCASAGCDATVLYRYGVAEVEAACLVGMRRGNHVMYFPVVDGVRPEVQDGCLVLHSTGPKGSVATAIDTGDAAEAVDGAWVIRNSRDRADPAVLLELDTWGHREWTRRTGYVRLMRDRLLIQLRENQHPESDSELPFFRFAERFGFSWLDKPNWAGPPIG